MGNHSETRSAEERVYLRLRPSFLALHPICPVTGERTSQVHHSAKRDGAWLLLQRYWIAVSSEGHRIIEDNKRWAEGVGLMVRIREPYATHCQVLRDEGLDLDHPIFYDNWNNKILWQNKKNQH
jgi:hypothetical protein